MVATFLAILELSKRGVVTLSQSDAFGEIGVSRMEGAPTFELDDSELTSSEEDL